MQSFRSNFKCNVFQIQIYIEISGFVNSGKSQWINFSQKFREILGDSPKYTLKIGDVVKFFGNMRNHSYLLALRL